MDNWPQVVIVAALLYLLGGCVAKGYSHIEELKEVSPEVWEEHGFQPVAYEGYGMGSGLLGTPFGSAKVWWRLEREGNNIVYSGYITKWGSEYHVYGPKAIDAIQPSN